MGCIYLSLASCPSLHKGWADPTKESIMLLGPSITLHRAKSTLSFFHFTRRIMLDRITCYWRPSPHNNATQLHS